MRARWPRRRRSQTGLRTGLTRRVVLASGLVALLAVGAYALLFTMIFGLRQSATVTSRSEAALASANRMERLVTDIEVSLRGFVITGDESFLRPGEAARAELPSEGAALERLAAHSGPDQERRARALVRDTGAYVRDYVGPVVAARRQGPAAAPSLMGTRTAERRLVALRARFDDFQARQGAIASSSASRSGTDARQATIIAAAGGTGALALIFFFAVYLARAILRPVRRASRMAGALSVADLTVRIPETSRNDMGVVEHTFNAMADSLQRSQAQLHKAAREQGALRRIATLIARGTSPMTIFNSVAAEMGRLTGADYTVINRYETGQTVTAAGHWSAPGLPDVMPPLGGHWPLEETTAAALILRTAEPARVSTADAATKVGLWTREQGIHHVVGCPILVKGHLWGMMAVFFLAADPPPDDTEDRMLTFVKLVSTAIENAETRNELLASAARAVLTSDSARRRIESDLRDVVQRPLLSLERRLREMRPAVPPDEVRLGRFLAEAEEGMASVIRDLRETTRGMHAVTLSRSGLGPALKALAQRSGVPVELTMRLGRPLSGQAELAVYYTVSEALTNVAKHARATLVRVGLNTDGDALRLSIHDDGIGGADATGGTGLVGLRERIEALGGTINISSPAGCGTTLLIDLPAGTG